MTTRPFWIALVALFLTAHASAQPTDGFSSDRPGYANGTASAPHLTPIVELGVGFTADEDEDETLSGPSVLLRFGLGEHLELRLALPSVTGVFAEGPNDVIFGSSTAGAKVAFTVGRNASMSFVPSVSIPTEGGPTTGRIEWNFSWSPGLVGIGGNLAGGSTGAGVLGEASLAIGLALGNRASVYAQSFLLWPEDQDPMPYVGAGFTYQVAPHIQIDSSFDIGLTDDTTRFAAGAGLTFMVGEVFTFAHVRIAPNEVPSPP